MIKVYQDIFFLDDPAKAETGNCFEACIASLIELPLKVIPEFCNIPKDDNWIIIFAGLLKSQGYVLHSMDGISPKGFSIASGFLKDSKKEHSCIYYNGQLFHDPLPNGNGIENIQFYITIRKGTKEELK